ncbi:MAG TPA: CPBP family intramembrane glutamic endopeptidase, partial [Candidatus Eisenbacteria bacterium]
TIFAGIGAVLTFFNGLNSIPLAMYDYETTQAWGAFLGNTIVGAVMGGLGVAIWIALFGAAGEPLYRRDLPHVPSLNRYLSRRTIGTKSFFRALVLGYTLVSAFMAYQCVFYVVAARFGAWAPAETPYSNLLNTQFPWITVLLIGFLPAVTEEFSNRMFSIPLYTRMMHFPWLRPLGVILAGFVWGFLHASYPNQPFWIRGVEVGLAGCVIGVLMLRYGVVPLLIWHFSVDAIYTALLLLRSGKPYFVVSGALAAGLLLVPLLAAVGLYLRRRGFTPEDDLTNAAEGFHAGESTRREEDVAGDAAAEEVMAAPSDAPSDVPAAEMPPPMAPAPLPDRRVSIRLLVLTALALALATIVLTWPTDYPPRRLDWPMGRNEALRVAADFLRANGADPDTFRSGTMPVSGFDRYRDDGVNTPPDISDAIAHRYVTETGGLSAWERLVTTRLPASNWESRFVKSLSRHEWTVTVDPRRGRVTGFKRTFPDEEPGAELDEAAARLAARELIRSMEANEPDGHAGTWSEIAAKSDKRPHRRDWTFVFDDSSAAVDAGVPRLTTILAGDRPAGYGVTLYIPEGYTRQRTLSTPLSTLLLVVRLLVMGGLFGLMAVEVIRSTRSASVPWRALLGLALAATLPSALAQLNRLSVLVFTYRSEIPWNLFLLTGSIGLVLGVIMQLMAVIAALL